VAGVISASPLTFAPTSSGIAKTVPVSPCVTFAKAPTVRPNLRATLFKSGSCFAFSLFTAMGTLNSLSCNLDLMRYISAVGAITTKKEVPVTIAGTSCNHCVKRKLGSAALTVAVLVVFFILVLPLITLLGLVLVLAGLACLTGLAGLLVFSVLVALLIFLIHIVCHENSSLR